MKKLFFFLVILSLTANAQWKREGKRIFPFSNSDTVFVTTLIDTSAVVRDSGTIVLPATGKMFGGMFYFSPGATQAIQTIAVDTIKKYSIAGTLNIINTSPYLINSDTGVSAQAWMAWWVQSDSTVGYFEWVAQKVAVGPGDSTVDYYLRRVYDVDRTTYQGTSYLDPIHFSQNTRTLHFLGDNTTGLPWGTVNINGGNLTMNNGTDIVFSNLVEIGNGVGGSSPRLKVKPISKGSSYIEIVPKDTGGAGIFLYVIDRDNNLTNYGVYELRANDSTGMIFKSTSAGSVTVDDNYTFNNTGTNKVGTSAVYMGSLFTNATQRIDASGNLSNIGTINATGEIHSSLMGVPALTIGDVDLGGDSPNRAIAYISSASGLSILSMGQSLTAYGQNVWRYNATEASAYWDFKSTKGISFNVNGGTAVPSSATNLAIGATSITTTASLSSGAISSSGILTLTNTTAPVSSPVDKVQLFTQDSSGTAGTASLFVRSEAGEVTQLSEHSGDAPEWMYDGNDRMAKSYNVYTGIITYINKDRDARLAQMERMKKQLPKDTLKLITFYEETFKQYNKRTGKNLKVEDWDANQNNNYTVRQKEIIEWTKKSLDHKKKLEEWKRLPFGKIPEKDRIGKPEFNEPQPKQYVKKQRPKFLKKK